MKKSLVALAALAVVGVASAQSSVTLFGVVDLSISNTTTKYENNDYFPRTPGAHRNYNASSTRMDHSSLDSSRLGFRGVEDLGGGLTASFWLEGALAPDAGGSTLFNRRSTLSLSGGFGEIRLGRDYKPSFWNHTKFSAFGTNGQGGPVLNNIAGVATGAGALNFDNDHVRENNSIGYFLPGNLGGVYGQVQYAFGEKVRYSEGVAPPGNDTRSGSYIGGRIGYAAHGLDVAVAVGQSIAEGQSDWRNGVDVINSSLNVGASYDFGFMELFGMYGKLEQKTQYDPTGLYAYINPTTLVADPAAVRNDSKISADGYALGVNVPVGPGLIRASYSAARIKGLTYGPYGFADGKPGAQKIALGYVHNLSKRTALYGTVAYLKNKKALPLGVNGAENATGSFYPTNSYGYDFGIRHSF